MSRHDVRHIVAEMPTSLGRRLVFFQAVPVNQQGFVLLCLSPHQQHELLAKLSNKEVISLLHYLDPDEATDILHNVTHHRRASILEELGEDIRDKVEFLLKFNPKSAAGMMSLDYIEVERSFTLKEVSRIVARHERRTGRFPTILVVQEGFLVGELPGHIIAFRRASDRVFDHLRKVPHVQFDADQKQVIRIFKTHPHDKIVVLDDENSILGIIYSDDILRLMENQEANTLADFAGVSQEEDVLDSAFAKVRHRYRWLIVNLATAFIAGFIVALFEPTLKSFVLLAAYIPIVAAMGTSAGTQTLAVVVRGLALHEVNSTTARRIIMAEMTAAALNGFLLGLLTAVIALLWHQSPWFGVVLFVTFFFDFLLAGLFGATIPLVMRRFGLDPATSSAIFIGTLTDISGFVILLSLATLVI